MFLVGGVAQAATGGCPPVARNAFSPLRPGGVGVAGGIEHAGAEK